jgi:regulator of chromosome condensation
LERICNDFFLSVGKVYSLGRHDYGRLGLGSDSDTVGLPTLIPALADVKCVEIACGNCVSYAISDKGKVYSWGMGSSSQLGIGGSADEDPDDVWEPQLMQGKALETRKVILVAGGGQHSALAAKDATGSG